jgi:hypothetical protein
MRLDVVIMNILKINFIMLYMASFCKCFYIYCLFCLRYSLKGGVYFVSY